MYMISARAYSMSKVIIISSPFVLLSLTVSDDFFDTFVVKSKDDLIPFVPPRLQTPSRKVNTIPIDKSNLKRQVTLLQRATTNLLSLIVSC